MKRIFGINLILLFIICTYLPLKTEEYFAIQIKKDGWELPKINEFALVWEKQRCRGPFNNCSEEYYEPKEKIKFLKAFILKKTFSAELDCIEIRSMEFIIEGLTITYYKGHPFCYFFGGKEGHDISSFVVIDLDLDGKFELILRRSDAKEFFFRFSPKVDENDRYKGPIIVDGKEIK